MPDKFLEQELDCISVPISNSWPYTDVPSLHFLLFFVLGLASTFQTMPDEKKLELCNGQLRSHMNSARWYHRCPSPVAGWEEFKLLGLPLLTILPTVAAVLSVMTSGAVLAMVLYGPFDPRRDLVRIWLIQA